MMTGTRSVARIAMKPVKYRLNIFSPGSVYDALVFFDASSPFMMIRRGDLLNPALWPEVAGRQDLREKLLRVVSVEHGIQDSDDHILQVLDVFTEAANNDEGTRLPGWLR